MSRIKPIIPTKIVTGGVDTGLQLSGGVGVTDLDSLTDVNVPTPNPGDVLVYDGLEWVASGEIESKIDSLLSGIEHGAAVTSIASAPPAKPVEGEMHIVGATPTGDFAGHKNQIALYESGAWTFTSPLPNEAHLNEADNSVYHWSGMAWNKVVGGGAIQLGGLTNVDPTADTAANNGDVLAFSGGSWRPTPSVIGSVSHIKQDFKAANQGLWVDIGTPRWTQLDIDGGIFNSSGPVGSIIQFADSKDVVVDMAISWITTYVRFASGSQDYGSGASNANFADSSRFSIAWAAMHDYVNNFISKNNLGASFRIMVTQTTAGKGVVNVQSEYVSNYGEQFRCNLNYYLNGGLDRVSKFRLTHNYGSGLMGYTGILTVI